MRSVCVTVQSLWTLYVCHHFLEEEDTDDADDAGEADDTDDTHGAMMLMMMMMLAMLIKLMMLMMLMVLIMFMMLMLTPDGMVCPVVVFHSLYLGVAHHTAQRKRTRGYSLNGNHHDNHCDDYQYYYISDD